MRVVATVVSSYCLFALVFTASCCGQIAAEPTEAERKDTAARETAARETALREPATLGAQMKPRCEITLVREKADDILVIKPSAPSKKLELPRLNNPAKAAYFTKDPGKKPFTLKSGSSHWTIVLPEESNSRVSLRLVGRLQLHEDAPAILPGKDGTVLLAAHHAITHGEKLQYEPQPHKNTVGYWAIVKDWAEWKFQTDVTGDYDVTIRQGCGKGHGGSIVNVVVGDQKLRFSVEDTGGFQNWKNRSLGSMRLPAGKHTLELRAIEKTGGCRDGLPIHQADPALDTRRKAWPIHNR